MKIIWRTMAGIYDFLCAMVALAAILFIVLIPSFIVAGILDYFELRAEVAELKEQNK